MPSLHFHFPWVVTLYVFFSNKLDTMRMERRGIKRNSLSLWKYFFVQSVKRGSFLYHLWMDRRKKREGRLGSNSWGKNSGFFATHFNNCCKLVLHIFVYFSSLDYTFLVDHILLQIFVPKGNVSINKNNFTGAGINKSHLWFDIFLLSDTLKIKEFSNLYLNQVWWPNNYLSIFQYPRTHFTGTT